MTTAPTPDLLPCPFCGGKPHHGKMMDESMWSRRRVPWRRVRCNECDISTDWVCKGASPSEIERWNRRAELEARKPLPLSDDERLRLRSDVARAIWDVMREYEDRWDHALEDVHHKHQVWDCADAAIRSMKDKP